MDNITLRRRFLDFYRSRGHTVVASAPLVPDDPTLLFVNAGMVPFKDTFLGLESRSYVRAASAQKCMRVSGKHNDLENVGPSARHHTFFEMLGNFSFGDYFKRDAIHYAWTFLTEDLGVSADRLVCTVFQDDDEAFRIWTEEIGRPPSLVLRMGEKTNFWMMADIGPCGPTSELHYDFGPEHCTCGEPDCSVALDNDCGRWLEIWNLVFMQYDQVAGGTRTPLPSPGVDTGMGMERITAIMQGVYSNYESDLFASILDTVQSRLGHSDAERAAHLVGYRVVADHGRAMTFLIADGVLPGNEGRNYVLRLIMRRAMRFGKQIGFEGAFLADVADATIQVMCETYPEVHAKKDWIRQVIQEEEARFARTLESGLAILDEIIGRLEAGGRIPGKDVFRLYDTFGFPPDLTRIVAEEHGLGIDQVGFEAAMREQKTRAQAGGRFAVGASEDYYRRLGLPDVEFLGYDTLVGTGRVLSVVAPELAKTEAAAESSLAVGASVEIVLDRTPFYAEAGGQVGDTGTLTSATGTVRVTDCRSAVKGLRVHYGVLESGTIGVGDVVEAAVDADRRADIERNHTATHLLHRALQTVLGPHAQQRGSLVAPDRLRFDFAHLKALTPEELEEIESQVNAMVRADAVVSWREMPLEDARHSGATMLFGEKYGDVVRVVTVAELSKELCGGTHLGRTGAIGSFVLTGESSIGAGLRRIEAQTGRGAARFIRARLGQLEQLARRLGTPSVEGIEARLDEVMVRNRELTRELEAARVLLAGASVDSLLDRVVDVEGVNVLAARVEATDADALLALIDALRDRLESGVVVLGAEIDGAPRVAAAVSEVLLGRGLHAGQLIKGLALELGGGGGGRPTLAQAGGKDAGKLDAALASVPDRVRDQLGAGGTAR